MKKFLLFTITALFAFLAPLHAQTMFSPKKGNERKAKSITQKLKIDSKDETSNSKPANESTAAVILPALVETGISVVKSELKKREESFSAEYSIKQSADGFWKNEKIVSLPKLKYTKTFGTDSTDALKFELTPHQSSDGLAFRYELSSLTLDYSQARATDRHNSINLEIDIKFTAFVRGEKEYSKKDLGENAIKIEGIKFSTPVSGSYFSGWFASIPHPGKNASYPNGTYEIELTIKEANPGVLSTQKTHKFFEDNGEKIQGAAKSLLKIFLKKKTKKTQTRRIKPNNNMRPLFLEKR